jgi:DNA recombination protein RmuC
MGPVDFPLLSALFIGGVFGGLIAWLAVRWRMSARLSRALAQTSAQIARFEEVTRSKEAEIQDKNSRIADLKEASSRLEASLLKISQERSAAEAKLEHMASVEQTLQERTDEVKRLTVSVTALKEKQAELQTVIEKERLATEEKLQLLDHARQQLADTFQAISATALKNSHESFLQLAKATFAKYQEQARGDMELRHKEVEQLVEPMRESLEKYDRHVQEMERMREKAYGGLSQQVESLMTTQQQLQKETANLVKALRTPQVRGRWGEITLRRVAELAGMLRYCDFFEQETQNTEQGRLRPDMIVRLPNEKHIVVDAKAPLLAYLEALEAETEEKRAKKLSLHARQIRAHMNKLSEKTYWQQFQTTPEFVVLFIPGENFFSSALEQNPGLIEEGVGKGVILATPTTLISLLKAVAFGWRQETIAESAQAISQLGKELYRRISTMAEHLEKLGRNVEKCVSTYNQVIGSFERRVLASARKFGELGVTDGARIAYLTPVEKTTRQPTPLGPNDRENSGHQQGS